MQIRQLENHLRTLIELDETESPVVSYFLDRDDPDGTNRLRERAAMTRKALDPDARAAFDRALDRIESHIPWKLDDRTRSVAVFARAGAEPLFIVLEFEVELESRLFLDSIPVIFPLVELKDNFHRYVLMICTTESARILEVSLGSVTRETWTRRPELRKRVGREWTHLHYQNHRRDRTERFLKEKLETVERIMSSGGHTHLMLAGETSTVARVRNALPRRLADRLIDAIPASARDSSTDVVLATLSTFLEHEEQESRGIVDELRTELLRGGLAVSGHAACREALEYGQADLLILPAVRHDADVARHEELMRLAVAGDIHVEVVNDSEELERLGGVGCLLRYQPWSRPRVASSDAA